MKTETNAALLELASGKEGPERAKEGVFLLVKNNIRLLRRELEGVYGADFLDQDPERSNALMAMACVHFAAFIEDFARRIDRGGEEFFISAARFHLRQWYQRGYHMEMLREIARQQREPGNWGK